MGLGCSRSAAALVHPNPVIQKNHDCQTTKQDIGIQTNEAEPCTEVPTQSASDNTSLIVFVKTGNIGEMLIDLFCFTNINSKSQQSLILDALWKRDDFDNIPIYYSILYGHCLCCAWLLNLMGGPSVFDPLELERFKLNALNDDIKALLCDKTDPLEYIRKHSHISPAVVSTQLNLHTQKSASICDELHPKEAVFSAVEAENEEAGDEDDGACLRHLFGDD